MQKEKKNPYLQRHPKEGGEKSGGKNVLYIKTAYLSMQEWR
jgi:hypothetical protein